MKKKNRINDNDKLYEIPDWMLIYKLLYPMYIRCVYRVYKKLMMINTNH
jgi:hypothetical protein